MKDQRNPVKFLEAVVRIPIYEGDEYGENGPGEWWEYRAPGFENGRIGTCNRPVSEISRRIVEVAENSEGANND